MAQVTLSLSAERGVRPRSSGCWACTLAPTASQLCSPPVIVYIHSGPLLAGLAHAGQVAGGASQREWIPVQTCRPCPCRLLGPEPWLSPWSASHRSWAARPIRWSAQGQGQGSPGEPSACDSVLLVTAHTQSELTQYSAMLIGDS